MVEQFLHAVRRQETLHDNFLPFGWDYGAIFL